MTCFHPVTVWVQTKADLDIPAKDYYALKKVSFKEVPGRIKKEIPCGKCIGCRLDHANEWATRIFMESKMWQKCCFVTLTYNNELNEDGKPKNLPVRFGEMSLKKKDIQDFMKRLRWLKKGHSEWINPRTGKKERPIRYFCCGEYGPKGGRPHYHMAIFNWEPTDLKLYKQKKIKDKLVSSFQSPELQKIWGKGFVVVEELNFNTAAYIARYVMKKAGLDPEKRKYTGKYRFEERIDERNGKYYTHTIRETIRKANIPEKEFIVMSRGVGIGRQYWEENKEKIKRNKGVFIKADDHVKLKPIPKYFKKVWEDENWIEYHQFKYEQSKEAEQKKILILSKLSLPEEWEEDEKMKWHLHTQEKILLDKVKYLKRSNFV